MILQTGGLAVGEISTRSRSFSRARSCACCRGTTPTCLPSWSMSRTSAARIMSLILDCGSAGLRSNRDPLRGGKIRDSSCCRAPEFTDKDLQSQGAGRDLPPGFSDELIQAHGTLVPTAPLAQAHRPGRCFLLSHDEHVRDLLELRIADLGTELFVAFVDFDPESGRAHLTRDVVRVIHELLRERQNAGLDRGEPYRERAGEMLDDDADEPLQRPKNCTVDHHRPVLGVVGTDIGEAEPIRLSIVELNGAELPWPSDGIGDIEIELRSVERSVPGIDMIFDAFFLQCLFEGALGGVPHRVSADPFFGSGRKIDLDVGKAEDV